jgi:hypothetical protein
MRPSGQFEATKWADYRDQSGVKTRLNGRHRWFRTGKCDQTGSVLGRKRQ